MYSQSSQTIAACAATGPAETLIQGLRAFGAELGAALCVGGPDSFVLMGRWARVLDRVHAAPAAARPALEA